MPWYSEAPPALAGKQACIMISVSRAECIRFHPVQGGTAAHHISGSASGQDTRIEPMAADATVNGFRGCRVAATGDCTVQLFRRMATGISL